jgi:hypothetical protein
VDGELRALKELLELKEFGSKLRANKFNDYTENLIILDF